MLWGLSQTSKLHTYTCPHPPGTHRQRSTGHHPYACTHAHTQALTRTDAHPWTDLHACSLFSPTSLRNKTAPAWGGFHTPATPRDSPSSSTGQTEVCLLLSRPEGFSSQTLSSPRSSPQPLVSETVDSLIAPFSFITVDLKRESSDCGTGGRREGRGAGVRAAGGARSPEGLHPPPTRHDRGLEAWDGSGPGAPGGGRDLAP